MPVGSTYLPDPRFTSLGETFFDAVEPAKFPRHLLRYRNARWAERVGLAALDDAEWEAHFARFGPLPENVAPPVALRYHGHQFGVYNPQLGDGRGFLFAQLRDARGRLLDLGTKGSGPTPWSRGGDGKLTLKGGVREVLATAMLEALGVETSKSFSLFETGESLRRGDEPSPTRSSVLVRLSHSHVRFGTFQRLAAVNDMDGMRRLVDYVLAHYYPALEGVAADDRPLALFEQICRRTATLAASWMTAGFVHGVLNTDNMNVTGESFDYGPYRFLPTYDVAFVAAYFDETGLYAFGRQPSVLLWNLSRLGDALRRIAPSAAFGQVLAQFEAAFVRDVQSKLLARLGLSPRDEDADALLVDRVFQFLDGSGVGFERFFFDAHGGLARARREGSALTDPRYRDALVALEAALAPYEPRDPVRLAHPYFARTAPCTLLIDEIESIWDAIAQRDDWAPFEAKLLRIDEMRGALESAPQDLSALSRIA
jgi:uncharacterized protein YdiU (UPF0061 family)